MRCLLLRLKDELNLSITVVTLRCINTRR